MNVSLDSPADRTWLEELLRRTEAGKSHDAWGVLIDLRNELPKGFTPGNVDPTLVQWDQITLLGVLAVAPESRLVRDTECAILAVREYLIQHPEVREVPAAEIGANLGFDATYSDELFRLMRTVGRFWEGSSGQGALRHQRVTVTEEGLREFLWFESLEERLQSAIDQRESLRQGARLQAYSEGRDGEAPGIAPEIAEFIREGRLILRETSEFRRSGRFERWDGAVGDWLDEHALGSHVATWTQLGTDGLYTAPEEEQNARLFEAVRQRIGWLGELASAGAVPATDREQKFGILRSPRQLERDFSTLTSRGVGVGALVFLDIDGFKRLNDELTEELIDREFLPEFQRLIEVTVAGRGTAYRQGGDEFILLLPNHTSREAEPFVERLRATIEEASFSVRGEARRVTVSAGVGCWPDEGSTVGPVREAANVAKKLAKDGGRNRVVLAGPARLPR